MSESIYVALFAHFRLFIYRKIPKISPGVYIFQRPFLRGFSKEGNLRFESIRLAL